MNTDQSNRALCGCCPDGCKCAAHGFITQRCMFHERDPKRLISRIWYRLLLLPDFEVRTQAGALGILANINYKHCLEFERISEALTWEREEFVQSRGWKKIDGEFWRKDEPFNQFIEAPLSYAYELELESRP